MPVKLSESEFDALMDGGKPRYIFLVGYGQIDLENPTDADRAAMRAFLQKPIDRPPP